MNDKQIRDIRYGMVFDHIPPGYGTVISGVLKSRVWEEEDHPVYTGEGLTGRKGPKDIVKLDGIHLKPGCDALNEIAFIHPDITVNWIEGSERTEKRRASDCIGDEIRSSLVPCENTNCIGNDEAPGRYKVLGKEPLTLRCHYCSRKFEARYMR